MDVCFIPCFPRMFFCGSETCFPPSLVEAESGRPAAAALPDGRERWCAEAKSTFRTVREYFPQSTRVFSAKYDSPHCLLSSAGRPEGRGYFSLSASWLKSTVLVIPGKMVSCAVPLSFIFTFV